MRKQYGRTNLLQENDYDYELHDVKEAELFRDSFPYDSVPRIRFNHRQVPMYFPDDIWITDTTFRDGQQSRAPFTVEQIVNLYKLMNRLGGYKGIIRQSEFFIYTEKDRLALEKCRELGYKYPEITTWIRASSSDFKLVRDIGVEETGLLVSCSDYHIFNKMGLTRKQAMDKYLGIVKDALSYGIKPRCHFEDITRADFYGFVLPFTNELTRLMDESHIPIKIRMCDTMGYGVSFPGASLPRSVPGIVYGLRFYSGVPCELLEWHGHNDFYKVVTNATTAWLYGASAVNCSLLGIGERTGNCPLEAMAIEYAQLMGKTNGMDLSVITEIAEYFENELDTRIPERTPFVGDSFNATRAGIHADGMLKDEEIYNIFDTEKILGRPPRVVIGEHSGAAGVAHWMNTRFKLKGDKQMDKRSETAVKLKEAVDKLYEAGRNTNVSDKEMDDIVKKVAPEYFTKAAQK
ncbi:MAG: 2-isopropylmalate synthase [Clostridia bacterium]